MRAKVALFRARDDAAASAARLRRHGFSVACLPAIDIKALSGQPNRISYDAVVATSDKAFVSDVATDRTSSLYVVGARTARAAEARGWRLASPGMSHAAQLVETLKNRLRPGARVLYLAGRDRKSLVETDLREGFAVEVIETYAAEARASWRPAEARALSSCVAALHYSRRSAELAVNLARVSGQEGCFLAMRHVCMSSDVAAPLSALGAAHLAIAETPDEPALFAALSREVGRFPSLRASRI